MTSKDKAADSADLGGGETVHNLPPNPGTFIRQVPAAALSGSAISADVRAQELMRKFFKGKVPTESKELMAALNRSLVLKGAEGRAPGGLSSLSSMGMREAGEGLTAAQASLYANASDAFNDAKLRLGELTPLRSSADPENVEALRTVTLTEYGNMVEELGRVDGPLEERVNKLFAALLDPQAPAGGDVTLGLQGLLKQIEEEFFGMKASTDSPAINNEEENQTFTDYQIVKIRLIEQYQRWVKFKGTIGTDYGAQSSKLLRLLTLIEAAVSDAEGAFDEISIEEIDRDSFEVVKDKLTLGALFSWIRKFALEEGRLLVETGGRIGVRATIPTLTALKDLVPQVISKVPDAGKPTVQSALGALTQRITDALEVATKIAPLRTTT